MVNVTWVFCLDAGLLRLLCFGLLDLLFLGVVWF